MDNPQTRRQDIRQKTLTWDAEEFKHVPKTWLWYIVFAIVSAGLIIFAWFSKSLLTIILFALLIVITFLFSRRSPRQVAHQLTTTAIIVGDVVYPYKTVRKFWIIYEPPHIKTLNIETTTYLGREISFQLGRQNPVAVKMFLKNYLLEDIEKEESLTDIIARRLKF